MGLLMAPKIPTSAPSMFKIDKVIPEDTLKDLIKGFKELKVEMSVLRKDQRPNTSQPIEGSKGYVVKVQLV